MLLCVITCEIHPIGTENDAKPPYRTTPGGRSVRRLFCVLKNGYGNADGGTVISHPPAPFFSHERACVIGCFGSERPGTVRPAAL